MSASMLPLSADVLALSRFGISEDAYRAIVEKLADQLVLDDDEQTNVSVQREADLEEAEWIVGVIHAAGYTITPKPR